MGRFFVSSKNRLLSPPNIESSSCHHACLCVIIKAPEMPNICYFEPTITLNGNPIIAV